MLEHVPFIRLILPLDTIHYYHTILLVPQTLLDWGCHAVVVTRGRLGAVAYFAPTSSFALAEKNGHHHPSSSSSSSSSSSHQQWTVNGHLNGGSPLPSRPRSSSTGEIEPHHRCCSMVQSSPLVDPVIGTPFIHYPLYIALSYTYHPFGIVTNGPPIPRTDTTGAGDAFAGAFLVEWCLTKDLRNSLRAGCCAGSAAVTLVGTSLPHTTNNYPRQVVAML